MGTAVPAKEMPHFCSFEASLDYLHLSDLEREKFSSSYAAAFSNVLLVPFPQLLLAFV